MHLFAPEVGMMGTSGIVGPCILQAAGAGYSFKLAQNGKVAAAFFGDGAVNNGAFHEGLNMAGIWKLPVLFICENNGFATEVPFSIQRGQSRRRQPRGELRAARRGSSTATTSWPSPTPPPRPSPVPARAAGATLIECRTYRTRPHAEGMGDYSDRTREEVEHWKTKCPILRLRQLLIVEGIADESELNSLDAEIEALAVDALAFAESSPWPDPETATTHVYAGTSDRLKVPASEPPRAITFMKATLEALSDAMEHDPDDFREWVRASVCAAAISRRPPAFSSKFGPVRLCDTPICERGFVGLACGAAMTGTRPVIDFMFADFVLDAVGEILNQIAKMQYMSSGRLKMPVLLRGCVGIGHSAATHHSGNYYPMYAHFPGLACASLEPLRRQGTAHPRPALRRPGLVPGAA